MANDDGKYVTCYDAAWKARTHQETQSRVLCMVQGKEHCPVCPNSQFKVKIQVSVGEQEVACPRWEDEAERLKGKHPTEYMPVRRELCLRVRPFYFCASCKNADPNNPPESVNGWVERHKRGGG